MFVLTKLARLAALGTLVIAGALSLPVRAEELVQNLGPVGPHDPILTTVGSKRVYAPQVASSISSRRPGSNFATRSCSPGGRAMMKRRRGATWPQLQSR
jgi:hypothetical protein